MEIIKKTILQAVTTGTTTGCTGTCRVIIPDLTKTYHVKFCLIQNNNDFGFFDVCDEDDINGDESRFDVTSGNTTISRLIELKKYKVTNIFTEQYFGNGSTTTNGVDYPNSVSGISVTYYIDGIKYVDNVTGSTTTFFYTPHGIDDLNFVNKKYYKDPNKENIISLPKIKDDVFIERQQLSAFDDNYKLQFIKNLVELTTYAGGKYFNIVNNT